MGKVMQTKKPRKQPAQGGVEKTKAKTETKTSAAVAAAAKAKTPKAEKKETKDPVAKKAKASEEIDGLFGQLKGAAAKKAKAEKEADEGKKGGAADGAKSKKVEGSKDDIFGTETGKGRKRTEEGFAIYSEEELGFGKKGGDTDLCPFDCDCCF